MEKIYTDYNEMFLNRNERDVLQPHNITISGYEAINVKLILSGEIML